VAVEEELALPLGVVAVEPGGVPVGGDVDALQPDLARPDVGVAVLELDLRRPQRLHLASLEGDARLDGVEHVVVVPGAPVAGHD
jgi:hypothetical protein